MPTLTPKQINEIAQELDCGNKCYWHQLTGELLYIPDFDSFTDEGFFKEEQKKLKKDKKNFKEIVQMQSHDSFIIMENFANQLPDNTRLKLDLLNALERKKPFSNFKYIIDNSGDYRQHWFDFKQAQLEQWVKNQLEPETESIEFAPEENYLQINKEAWNNKTEIHINSEFYNQKGFLSGNTSLNEIELEMLGNIKGKKILHLQCHFGQDTISLSRLGADVTGIDLSDIAIQKAKEIALETNSKASFICCNIYDLPNHLNQQFDIVFTSYGTIGWLPNLNEWANIISSYLKPNGQFIFVEFHPVVWMFDDNFEKIAYNYFNNGPIVETESGTYADKTADLKQKYIMWNHSTSEVINSLISNGLEINSFNEFDYSPYNCFNKTIEIAPKKYRIEHLDNKIPMVFSLVAKKK